MKQKIRLEAGRRWLWQWDVNQRVELDAVPAGTQVHYSYDMDENPDALVTKVYEAEGKYYSDIPNIMLQEYGTLYVYIYTTVDGRKQTEAKVAISVLEREKPADYVYTETEVLNYAALDERVKTLEEGSGTVKSVNDVTPDETGNVAIEIPKVEVDPTLTKEGFAADAKAVGGELGNKEPRVLRVTFMDAGSSYKSSHSASEIKAHVNAGGSVVARLGDYAEIKFVHITSHGALFERAEFNNIYADVYYQGYHRYLVAEDKSVTHTVKQVYFGANNYINEAANDPVTGKAVYNYAVPIPETAEVGQVLAVKAVNGNGKPYAWEPVGMPKAVTIDPTLSIEGQAADAKAVGDALADKAKKPLIINADDAPTTGSNSVSGIPIFTIDYTPADLLAYKGKGSVEIVRYNRNYVMYDVTEETAKFRFFESTDMQVDWYHAVLDANRNVTITKTTHKSRMETTIGGTVGQIPIIKSLDSKGRPSTWEFVGITDILPVYSGEVGEV